MPIAQLDDISLYYERAGNGDPLLFISGTGGDLRNKPSAMDGPLAKQFDMTAYDQRGLGQSDKPDQLYSMADYADDALRLLDHLKWDRARVVGVSFGGMVAQNLAVAHPDRIEKLVLCCTAAGGAGGASYPLHELSDFDHETRARRSLSISDIRLDADWQAANPEKLEAIITFMVDQANRFSDEPGRAMGAQRQLEARKDHDCWEALESLTIPTLVMGGRFDGLASPEVVQALADRIPNARLQWFDGGHMFLIEDRTAFPAMIKFLVA